MTRIFARARSLVERATRLEHEALRLAKSALNAWIRRVKKVFSYQDRPSNQLAAISGGVEAVPTHLSHHEHYKLFRDYLLHEDDLINNRLNWNFTIQGFLFTAYTFTIQKIAELKDSLLANLTLLPSDYLKSGTAQPSLKPETIKDIGRSLNANVVGLTELRFVVIVVAGVGLFVSVFVFLSVWAARTAIGELEAKWLELNPEYERTGLKNNTHGPYLPGIIGAGNPEAHGLGFQAPILLPIGFAVAWCLLLLYAFWGYLDRFTP